MGEQSLVYDCGRIPLLFLRNLFTPWQVFPGVPPSHRMPIPFYIQVQGCPHVACGKRRGLAKIRPTTRIGALPPTPTTGSFSSVDSDGEEEGWTPMTDQGRRHTSFRALLGSDELDHRRHAEVFQLAVGGHRGNGANTWTCDGPSQQAFLHRENTIKSMLAAVELGVSFLEFDVQVTRDGVCVIYHDNYVVVGDEMNPNSRAVADMELEEFKGASPVNSVLAGGSEADELEGASDEEVVSGIQPLPHAYTHPVLRGADRPPKKPSAAEGSLAGASPGSSSSTASKMLLRQYRNGVEASGGDDSLRAWTVVDDEEFPTLLDVFERIPPHVGFDIEIKMATGEDVVKTPDGERWRMTDAILRTVDVAEARARALGRPVRPLLFSSFDPDVCEDVKRRRPGDWVMFLTTGGTSYHADRRRMSIDAAIEVAALHGLEGIIVDSGALYRDHRAVERARRAGLKLMTYGVENDDVAWVSAQQALGVHGVIVDDVAKVNAAFLGDRHGQVEWGL